MRHVIPRSHTGPSTPANIGSHKLTLANDRTAIIDGCTAAVLGAAEAAARTAKREAAVRAAEENMAGMGGSALGSVSASGEG